MANVLNFLRPRMGTKVELMLVCIERNFRGFRMSNLNFLMPRKGNKVELMLCL